MNPEDDRLHEFVELAGNVDWDAVFAYDNAAVLVDCPVCGWMVDTREACVNCGHRTCGE